MVKQLNDRQESYVKGLIDSGRLTYREIQGKFKEKYSRTISLETLFRISKRSRKIKHQKMLPQNQKSTTPKQDRLIFRVVKSHRWNSWAEIALILKIEKNIDISINTIKRRCKEFGLKSFVAKKGPALTPKKIQKRLEFAQKYKNWKKEDWEKVIFLDESKIGLSNDYAGLIYVKRTANSKNKEDCYKHQEKFQKGNVKIWGSISSQGPGPLELIEKNMTGAIYKEILETHLFKFVSNLGIEEDYKVLQDNDPKHKSKIVQGFLDEKEISVFSDYPPNSPDLNPIEHAWALLKVKVAKRKPKNIQELSDIIKDEWSKMNKPMILSLVHSMPDRLSKVIRNNGGKTDY